MTQFLHIGTIRRAHGLRGQVKVALDNADSDVLEHLDCLWTRAPESGPGAVPISDQEVTVDSLRKWELAEVRPLEAGLYLVTLAGVADRTAAEALQRQEVYARRDELPELTDDEVYQSDLIGCQVFQAGGGQVGTVSAIEQMNGNFLLVITREGREDALVPLVAEMITDIDLAAGRVEIDPPEGLLDLDLRGD